MALVQWCCGFVLFSGGVGGIMGHDGIPAGLRKLVRGQ